MTGSADYSAVRLPWFRRLLLTLAIGACGGALAHWADLPLAWILGPACAAAAARFAGLPVAVPQRFRGFILAVLGTFIGSAFSPETVDQLHRWPASIIAVVLYVPIVTAGITAWYLRAGRLDPVTAFFAATPGGLGPMIILGGAHGGDESLIALLQTLRVFTLVVLSPLLAIGLLGDLPAALPTIGTGGPLGLVEGALLALAVIAGVWAAAACRLPAPQITGALLVSAALHLSGVISGRPPTPLLVGTLVVLGSALGCQMAGLRLAGLGRIALVGLSATLVLLALTAVASYLLAAATGLPFVPLLLAMAPGGVPEMSMIAVAMGIDPAFVAFHHLVRMSVILLVAPQIGRLIARRHAVA